MPAFAAARLHDPIEHTSAMDWLLKGVVLGAAIGLGAALVLGTGGLAGVALIAGTAAAGGGIGAFLSNMSWAPKIAAGKIAKGSNDVLINLQPAARAHMDSVDCSQHPSSPRPFIAQGSTSVLINGMHAARVSELATCSAAIAAGSPNVFIGGDTETTDDISPEVPPWLHVALLAVGLASAAVLLGPLAALASFVLGLGGAYVGHIAGGAVFGEDSDGQRWTSLGGGLLGTWAGAKSVPWIWARTAPRAYHHTFQRRLDAIRSKGLRKGSFATPTGGLSPSQAQVRLSLDSASGVRDAVLQIDLQALRAAGYEIPPVTHVWPRYGMPGRGYEMQFPYEIPSEYITVIEP